MPAATFYQPIEKVLEGKCNYEYYNQTSDSYSKTGKSRICHVTLPNESDKNKDIVLMIFTIRNQPSAIKNPVWKIHSEGPKRMDQGATVPLRNTAVKIAKEKGWKYIAVAVASDETPETDVVSKYIISMESYAYGNDTVYDLTEDLEKLVSLGEPDFYRSDANVNGTIYSLSYIKKEKFIEYLSLFDNRPYSNFETSTPDFEMFTPEWFKEKATNYETFDSEAKAYRDKFLDKYSIEAIESLSGKDVLTRIFLNKETTDNLCCEMEYNTEGMMFFGSIRSGFSTKYGLYYSKKKESWAYGPSSKQEFITEEEAIEKGTELRDYLIAGAKVLMDWNDFSSAEDYKKLYEKLAEVTAGNVGKIWFLKYYQMLRPDILPTIYSDNALEKAMSVLSLETAASPIESMGQIKLFVDRCEISNALACRILWDNYPEGADGDTIPEELLDPDENEQRFRKWMSTQTSVNGRPCTPGMISNNCSALKKVCNLMDIIEYPEVDSIFQITDIDTFIDIKEIIKGHPDYDEVNLACNNRFLSTGLKWYEKYLNEILAEVNTGEEPETIAEDYDKDKFLEKVFLTSEEYDKLFKLLMYKKNVILQGAPGVGKTFLAKRFAYSIIGAKDDRFIEVIQFHQNYSYEDFIMGYKPTDDNFELKTGLFYNFCKKAEKDPDKTHKYFFIIDEINRGNLSKIFGELMMLIEGDKRGPQNRIKLAYRDEEFFVPENIYIIGMMNTADRSLAMMDYALRRRFSFFDVEPAFGKDGFKTYLKTNIISDDTIITKIIDRFKALNAKIADEDNSGLGKGFCIGHSYFCNPPVSGQSASDWYNAIIEFEVSPLLDEYWWDDKSKAEDCKKDLMKD